MEDQKEQEAREQSLAEQNSWHAQQEILNQGSCWAEAANGFFYSQKEW